VLDGRGGNINGAKGRAHLRPEVMEAATGHADQQPEEFRRSASDRQQERRF
jgi:hypothetical protein